MAESSSPSNTPAPIAEIDHGPSKLDQFLDKHQKKLVLGAILVALGVAAYVVYDGLAEADAQEAGSALQTAEKVAEYQDVIKKWPESNAAASAMVLLADLQWEDSQPDSVTTLQDFINKYPEHPSLATAKVSLGLRLLEQGKNKEAVEMLTDVVENDESSYIAPLAFIALGDIAKAAGKPDDAKVWYEQAELDPTEQGNTFKDVAALRLALVNAKPPVKIKPALPTPPVPPAPPAPGAPAVTPPLLETPDTPDATPAPAPVIPTPAAPVTPPAPATPKTPETPAP